MQKYDIDILKKNVRSLMDEHGTKQEDLAQYLEMSQSNVSKALSLKDKKCFTLEQTCRISDYFNVSVDYLVGKRTTYSAANNREIAEMLVTLIESGAVSFDEVKMKEHVYTPGYQQGDIDESDRDMVYPALFFRNYWTPDLMHDEDGAVTAELQAFGNTTNNYQINEFMQKFIQIYTVFKRGELFEETYKAVVQDYLSRVE